MLQPVQECTDEQSRSSRTSTSVSIALIDTFPATSTQCETSIHGGAEFLNGPALASAAALRQIIDNFVNQETRQRPERVATLFSSSVRRSIKGVCAFTLRHNRLEAALHGTGGQTIWVFHCDWCHRPLVHLKS